MRLLLAHKDVAVNMPTREGCTPLYGYARPAPAVAVFLAPALGACATPRKPT